MEVLSTLYHHKANKTPAQPRSILFLSSQCTVWMEWHLRLRACLLREATVARWYSRLSITMDQATFCSAVAPCSMLEQWDTEVKLVIGNQTIIAKTCTASTLSSSTKRIRTQCSSNKNEKNSKISIATSRFSTILQTMRIPDWGLVPNKWTSISIVKKKRLKTSRGSCSSKPPTCRLVAMHQLHRKPTTSRASWFNS